MTFNMQSFAATTATETENETGNETASGGVEARISFDDFC